jgi:hypothetical protein
MATENFKIKDLEIHGFKTDQKLKISDQFLTEQELLSQLEELRKKQKEMEITNNEIRISKQKDYLIDKIRKFLDMQISDEEIIAVCNDSFGGYLQNQFYNYYLKVEDQEKKLLTVRKVFNRYARVNEIRYEDSVDIIKDFLIKLKPLNDYNEWQRENQIRMHNQGYLSKRRSASPKGDKIHEKIINEYIPLFC